MPFNWLDNMTALSPVNLTIREQTRTLDNPLTLRYRDIFPRINADSIKLSEITVTDVRYIGGRREWNAQGREIPENLGPARNFEMVPINPTHHIDERMLQLFGESGVQELLRNKIIKSVNEWPTTLADSTERQLEVEAFESWFNGVITVMDPKTGQTVTASMGFTAGTTYITAATAWDNVGVNAYDQFLVSLQNAQNKMGLVGAARTRRAVIREIVKDSPTGPNGLRPTITMLQERIAEEGFPGVVLIPDERTYKGWTDGGSAQSAEAFYVPAGKIAFQPASGVVGNTHVAPVVRAFEFLPRQLAKGVVIFRTPKNDGKTLMIEAQQNALVLPDENKTYVVDTLVAA